jgi:hypothetical protein
VRLLCLLLFALPALAQFESNSLEVTATRTVTIQPDVVTFNVNVTAGATISMDAIVAALPQPFTASDFVSAGAGFLNIGSGTQWYFSKSLPIASMGSALTALNSAQAKLGKSMTLTFNTQAVVSPTAKAANPCPYGALMSDASAQAQQTASAAGLKLGPVVGLSDGSDLPADQVLVGVSSVAEIGPAISFRGVEFTPPATPATCTLVVRFQLRQ